MKWLVLGLVLGLGLAGCGGHDATLRATLSLSPGALRHGLATTDIQGLDFAVLVSSTCATLPPNWSSSDSVTYHRFITATATHLVGVPSGKNLVVVVTAFSTPDGLGVPIASGCVDQVVIESGKTRAVSVTLTTVRGPS